MSSRSLIYVVCASISITTTFNCQESSLHGMEVKRTQIYRLLWQKIFYMNNEKENSKFSINILNKLSLSFEVRQRELEQE